MMDDGQSGAEVLLATLRREPFVEEVCGEEKLFKVLRKRFDGISINATHEQAKESCDLRANARNEARETIVFFSVNSVTESRCIGHESRFFEGV
jgi:hypothetical protein